MKTQGRSSITAAAAAGAEAKRWIFASFALASRRLAAGCVVATALHYCKKLREETNNFYYSLRRGASAVQVNKLWQ